MSSEYRHGTVYKTFPLHLQFSTDDWNFSLEIYTEGGNVFQFVSMLFT